VAAVLILGSIFLVGVAIGVLDIRSTPTQHYFRLTTFRYPDGKRTMPLRFVGSFDEAWREAHEFADRVIADPYESGLVVLEPLSRRCGTYIRDPDEWWEPPPLDDRPFLAPVWERG
jgi:hypothetical protein